MSPKYLDFMFNVSILRGAIAHAKKYNREVVKYYYLQGSMAVIVNESDEFDLNDDTYYVTVGENQLGNKDDNAYIAYGAFEINTNELEALLDAAQSEQILVTMKYNLQVEVKGHTYDIGRLTSFEVPEGGKWAKVDTTTGELTYFVSKNKHFVPA